MKGPGTLGLEDQPMRRGPPERSVESSKGKKMDNSTKISVGNKNCVYRKHGI